MFFEVARILKDKRPRYFILENVKGLLNHDSGKTFQTILKILTDLGYQVQWQLLNSKFFGVPQNRERVYIVGCYGKGCAGKIFPLTPDGIENISTLNKHPLGNIKGRFLLSYDDSPKVRELYKGFEMIEVERQNGINNREGTSRANKVYKELLIANYPIKELFKNV